MTVERSLIIPMFDEATRIEASLRELAASPLNDPDTEILLVDDGSADATIAVAERAIAELGLAARVIRLPENRGKGAAVREGMRQAIGQSVAFVDADLSAPPGAVVTCFEHIEAGKGDIVVTTRVHPEAVITEFPSMTRRYGGKIFNTLLRLLGLTSMSDTQCGLKAFTAEAAKELFADLRVLGYAFDVEVLQRAQRAGMDIVELPIEWHHVEASRVRPLRDGARMAVDAVRIRVAFSRGADAGTDTDRSRLRIHMVSLRDLDDPGAGGSELHLNRLALEWAAAGHDVVIRTSAVAGGPEVVERDGYRVVRRGGRVAGLIRSPLSEVFRRQGPRDVLVEVWHGINFFGPLWCRGPRIAIAHHVHGEQFRYVLPRPIAYVADVIERGISPRLYRTTPLVTLSSSARRELVELGFDPANVHVVSPGVDPRFKPGGERSPHPTVLTVGRLMPQKRVDEVIEALKPVRDRHPDLEYVVVGTGPEEERLRAAAPPWVTFAGRVDDDELVRHYQSAWVVATASIAEGWNMTLTEAGACGTPAVATRISGHVDAVIDETTGLLVDGRSSMTAALLRVLDDDRLRSRLGDEAIRHAARHTWDNAAASMLDLVTSVVPRVPRRART